MLEFVGVSIMIKFKNNIDNICEYQTSILPDKVTIIKTPKSVEEMMKISFPIAIILCLIMFITIFIKTLLAKTVVISTIMLMVGLLIGFSLLIIHEWLHAVIYPKNATVTIGRLKGKLTFFAWNNSAYNFYR
jgi:fatty acid desaturase